MTAKISYQGFWRIVTCDGKARCALARSLCWRCGGEGCLRCDYRGQVRCSRTIDAHHFVPKRRLETAAAKLDVRNGVPLCRDHHDAVEQGLVPCPRPPELEFFLADHQIAAHKVPGVPPTLKLVAT